MRTIRTSLVFSSLLVCASCLPTFSDAPFTTDTQQSSTSVSESSSLSSAMYTNNVNYSGILRSLSSVGIGEATHRLELSDGRFLFLVASDHQLDLNSYLDRYVQVRGTVRAGADREDTLLSVENIIDLSASSSDSSSSPIFCGGIAALSCPDHFTCVDDPSDSCDPAHGGGDCSGICVREDAVSLPSSSQHSSFSSPHSLMPSSSSSSSSFSVASSLSSSFVPANAAQEEQIEKMAKQDYSSASFWTQTYCTTHISFCVPVHKQWYYQSFGTKGGSLWHVEFGMAEIDVPGQGVVTLDLLSGSSTVSGAANGQILTQGSTVVGFLDWGKERHFEIKADARLQGAIAYMLAHIQPYPSE